MSFLFCVLFLILCYVLLSRSLIFTFFGLLSCFGLIFSCFLFLFLSFCHILVSLSLMFPDISFVRFSLNITHILVSLSVILSFFSSSVPLPRHHSYGIHI